MSIRICVPNLVAVRRSCRKGGGGGTERQTKDTVALYSRLLLKGCAGAIGLISL